MLPSPRRLALSLVLAGAPLLGLGSLRAQTPLGQGANQPTRPGGGPMTLPIAPLDEDKADPRFAHARIKIRNVVQGPHFRRELDTPRVSNQGTERFPLGLCYGINLMSVHWFQASVRDLLTGAESVVQTPDFGVEGPIRAADLPRFRMRALSERGGIRTRAWAEELSSMQWSSGHKAKAQGLAEVFRLVEADLRDPSLQCSMVAICPPGEAWHHSILIDRIVEGELDGPVPPEWKRVRVAEFFDPMFADRPEGFTAGFGLIQFPDARRYAFTAETLRWYNTHDNEPLQKYLALGEWQVVHQPIASRTARARRWVASLGWRGPARRSFDLQAVPAPADGPQRRPATPARTAPVPGGTLGWKPDR